TAPTATGRCKFFSPQTGNNSVLKKGPMTAEPKQRFVALDSWRGICAVLVAMFHLSILGHIYYSPLVRHAFLFVDFFFVLSGFVITYAYTGELSTASNLRVFAIRRLGRVW